jgi:glycosyltransferase involved in cell wall biosynthesis
MTGLRAAGLQVDGFFPSGRSMAMADFTYGLKLPKKAKAYDIVHAHTDISWNTAGAIRTFHGVAALGEHYYRQKPAEGLMPWHKQEPYFVIHKSLERASARANKCVAVSDYVKDALVKYYGAREDNVTTVYNGIDSKRFSPDAKAGQEFRARHKIPSNAMLLTWVGHAEFNKGIDYLISAFNQVVADKHGKGIALALRSPLDKHGLMKRGMTAEAVERVFPVPIEKSLAGFYNASDIHLLSSVYEPFCLTLLEAMSCEKPVIASDSGGHAEIISKREGRITPLRDAKAMALAVLELANDRRARSAMGRSARKLILSGFTKEHMVKRTLAHYREVAPK